MGIDATSVAIKHLFFVTLYGWRAGKSDAQETAETVTMLDTMTMMTLVICWYPDTDIVLAWDDVCMVSVWRGLESM